MISGVRASSIRIEFDLVHDGVDMPALDHVLQPIFHIVAQIIEAELVVGAVGHIGVIGDLALLVVEAMHDHADLKAEKIVDLPHPFGVAPGEVVIDRHHMHAATGESVEVDRQRGHQGLAFAGLHLRDPAFMQNHAADELHVEMPLPESAFGGFAAGGEGRYQDIVERSAVGHLLLENFRARPQLLVGKRLEILLERIDLRHARKIALDSALVRRAKQLAGDGGDHAINPSRPVGCRSCQLVEHKRNAGD